MSAPVTESFTKTEEKIIERITAALEERAIAREERLFERLTAAMAAAMAKAEERNADNFASIAENFASIDIKLNSREPFALTQERLRRILEPESESSEAARAEAQADGLDLSTTTYSTQADQAQTHSVFVGAAPTLVEPSRTVPLASHNVTREYRAPVAANENLASATERSARVGVKLNNQEPLALTQERLEPAKPDSSEAARAEAQPLRQLPPGRLSYRLHDGDAWHDLKARNVMIDPWLPPPWQELSSGNWWMDLF